MKTKIFLIDDDKEQADSLQLLVNTAPNLEFSSFYQSIGHFFEEFSLEEADCRDCVIILDIELRNINSLSHIQKIKRIAPQAKILIYSGHISNDYLIKAVRNGADAYLVKGSDPQFLFDAIHAIIAGEKFFDPKLSSNITELLLGTPVNPQVLEFSTEMDVELHLREKQVARGLLDGLSYQEIADQNNLSINTIRHYVRSLYKKLEVNSKIDLIHKIKGNIF